jgi:uncharacterized membrane protein
MRLVKYIIVVLCLMATFGLFFYGMHYFLGKRGVTIVSIIILIYFTYGFIRDAYYHYRNK